MSKLIAYRNLFTFSIVFTMLALGFLTFMITARTASAADVRLDIDNVVTTGGWVGQQVELYSSGVPGRWVPNTRLQAAFEDQHLVITNVNDDPIELVTDANGFIPAATATSGYFFRVPLAKRGLNQIAVRGEGILGVDIVTNVKTLNFNVTLGINVSKIPLPDWLLGSAAVGGWLNIYGTGFGSSFGDEFIVILWDGNPVRYFLNADGDGRWNGGFWVPETEGQSSSGGKKHVIEVFSNKQPINLGASMPDSNNPAATGRGATNSNSNGTLLPTVFSVRPDIQLPLDHARVNDRITINGTGFRGNPVTTVATVSLTMSLYASAPYIIPTTDSSNIATTVFTSSKGSFTASIKIPDLGGKTGPAIIKVLDSAGNNDNIAFNVDSVVLGAPSPLTPANGATFLSPKPTFTYTPVAGTPPVTYELQIDNNSDFSSPTRWARFIDDTDWTPGAPIQPGIYFWRVRAMDGALPSSVGPWSSSSSFTITTITAAMGSLGSGWNMFASPIQIESGKLSEMLAASDVKPYFFRYVASLGTYALTDSIDVGRAYWVKANSDTLFFFEGMATPGTADFMLALDNGWNQIADPFVLNLNGNNIRVTKDAVTKTVPEAQVAGWIVPYVYYYDPAAGLYGSFYLTTGSLKPHIGYWVRANVPGVSMVFQSPPTPPAPPV